MQQNPEPLLVTSHVARDLIQAAALFKTDKQVVWEYVSNGLQYVDPGTEPCVVVTLDSRKKKISIKDNGRGMDWEGLKNFFKMHGENIDRQQGKPGRGRFGTGKSAAFGIGAILRITTVRDGRRSRVELRRDDIEAMNSGDPIPVRQLERETKTTEANGTLVDLEEIQLKSLDQAGVIHFVERHLAHWRRDAIVLVNNHQCEFNEPPVAEEETFCPDPELEATIGSVKLVLKISRSPLDADLRGIAIFSNGVWYETTLAGAEGREMSQYIFGEIDVPALDDYEGPIAAFDMSRSMELNPNNPVVQGIYEFIGPKIEEARRRQVEKERVRRATEEARRLQSEAQAIANVINEDFESFRRRLARVRAKATGGSDLSEGFDGEGQIELLKPGGDVPGTQVITHERHGDGPHRIPNLEKNPEGPDTGLPTGETRARQTGTHGGFRVEFDNLGSEENRAKYVADERTIYINLDHPQIAAAKGLADVEEASFRRLSYEVAFSEYAVALASELAQRNEYLDVSDPIVDIRDTLNRLARRGAALYERH
jgi:hypothetical protein